jgi:2-succinyl-5-enolpyruvyl-6-hydroxy-3-cyclohexene-1-carboxylate synthase
LRVEPFAADHRPDLVVRIGAPLTSKVAGTWLGECAQQFVIDPDRVWLDPHRGATELLAVDAAPLLVAVADALGAPGSSTWLDDWCAAERTARDAIDDLLDGWEEPFEGRVARDLVAGLPDGASLHVASSMPVRDVESFAGPRRGLQVLANRGVNGIDGFVSTALGSAAAGDAPMVALLGDLCLLHDTNGLLGANRRGIDATLVVLDNDGGGIFSFLPQADLPEHFELLFGTPHGIDLSGLAELHGIPCAAVEKASELLPAVRASIAAGGVRMVLVRTDRADNLTRHREAWAAVNTLFGR